MRLQLLTCDYGVRAMKSKLGTSNGGRLSLLGGGGRAVARPQVCHTHLAQPGARDRRRRWRSWAARVNIQEAMTVCRVRRSSWSRQTQISPTETKKKTLIINVSRVIKLYN